MSTISALLRTQVQHLAQGRCAYCHAPVEMGISTFEIDHIIPLSKGGKTTLDNLCLACPHCNRHKANRFTAIDPLTNDPSPLFHPYNQVWAKHFAYDAETGHILGLTSIGRATVNALVFNRPRLIRLRLIWYKLGYLME